MLRRLNVGVVRIACAIGLVLLMCGAMAAQQISTNYMPGTDFSKYKTYKWVIIQGSEQPNQIYDQMIKDSVDHQMAAKGFIKSATEQADLYVGYQVSIAQQQQLNAYGMGGGWRWGGGMATATTTTIRVGTLDLDMYDPAAKQLVWQGQATKTLNPSSNPQTNQNRLNQAMAKLLKGFPPKPKK